MAALIATIILFGSLSGMAVILFRKVPVLVELPSIPGKEQEGLFLKTKRKIKELDFFEIFDFKNFLQKFLMRIRILTLKIENTTSKTLEGLRQKERMKNNFISNSNNENNYKEDNYWKEIKKFNNKKTKSQKPKSKLRVNNKK
ncbi:hypothetical protein KAU51_01560 [Candidatus Parcubacteria bacterium]|nr:hypothetical protein [Candidatus Parcubacteria bacterium]